MKLFLPVINAICALLIILCTAVEIPTFSESFYLREYEKYDIPNKISVSKHDLSRVTVRLQDYMRNKEENLDIYVTVADEYREFFNTKEKQHMVDVKYLFTVGFYVRNITLVLFFMTGMLSLLAKLGTKTVAMTYFIVFLSFLLMLVLLAVVISLDFEAAFNVFHKIFFTNDLWQLDPGTDLLINIMPLGFFIDISKYIAGLFVGACAVVISSSIIIVRFKRGS